MPTTLSFVIPALNEEACIGACLDSVLREARPEDEVVVVDNGSDDATPEIVAERGRVAWRVVSDATVAALRNVGARETGGEVLAFVDADCTVEPGWRDAVVELTAGKDVGAVGSPVRVPATAGWIPRVWWSTFTAQEGDTDHLVSANMAVRRDAFEEVGGFNPELETDEDTELCVRLRRAGWRVVESPRVQAVHHDNPETLGAFFAKERWHAAGIVPALKHQGVDKPLVMTGVFAATLVVAAVSVVLAALEGPLFLLGVASVGVAPLTTAVFRIAQGARPAHLPHLFVLYTVFYLARVVAIGEAVVGGDQPSSP